MVEARGREIRLTEIHNKNGYIEVRAGAVINLDCTHPFRSSDNKTFYCNSDTILRFLKPNDVVYFDDGAVVCIILEIANEGCSLEVKIGGCLKSLS